MPSGLAFLLTACAAFRPSAEAPIILPDIPEEVRECPAPQELPAGFMSQAKVERYWSRDRAALIQCRTNLQTVVDYYDHLQEHLEAEEGETKLR